MQSFRKSIVFFSEEKYRDLDYGTVYYVASRQTPELNEYVKTHAEQIAEQINSDEDNWITCKIIYLEEDNPLFPSCENATLYSAMMPEDDMYLVTGDSNFLVATLVDCEPIHMDEAFSRFFSTLQQMFDEVLDKGTYNPNSLGITYLGWADDGIRFSIVPKEPDEKGDSLAEGIKFSISGRGKPDTSKESDYKLPDFRTPRDGRLLNRDFLEEVTRIPEETPAPSVHPSCLVITENTYSVLLPDWDKEFHFTTQVKALYILFLNHPEGIRMKEIADYKKEFSHIYLRITTWSDVERLKEIVDKLLDVCNRNALDAKKSQCNRTIRETISDKVLQKFYEIEVHPSEPHKINLDRSLVSMPDILKTK
jgi:hypothetical protein